MAASRAELDAATSQVREATAALHAARDAVERIRANRRAGDQSVTALDLATAEAQVSLCEDDITHANNRLARAKKNLVNDDTTLAGAIAGALGSVPALAGMEIVSVTETPDLPDAVERPVLHLVQDKAPTLDTISGMVAGGVEAILVRPAWARPLDTDALFETLNKTHVYADCHNLGSQEVAGHHEDRARIAVRGAWPAVPVIRHTNGVSQFGQTLAGRVRDAFEAGVLTRPARGVVTGRAGSSTAVAAAMSASGDARVTSEHEANGRRRTKVSVDLGLSPAAFASISLADAQSGTRTYLDGMVGRCESGLGRIASVTLRPASSDADRPGARPTLRLTADFEFESATA